MIASGSLPVEGVNDEEHLHRSVLLRQECFVIDAAGNPRVSAQAFSDRQQKPSVFRRHLCDNPPWSNPPRMSQNDAVAGLVCGKVREEGLEHKSDGEASPTIYEIDVKPDVSDDQHISHAVIFLNPEGKTRRPFEKLKERLALVAENEWDVAPSPEFVEQLRRTKMP